MLSPAQIRLEQLNGMAVAFCCARVVLAYYKANAFCLPTADSIVNRPFVVAISSGEAILVMAAITAGRGSSSPPMRTINSRSSQGPLPPILSR